MSDQAEVLRRVRDRVSRILTRQGDVGFGARQADKLVLGDVELEGVRLHGVEDTVRASC